MNTAQKQLGQAIKLASGKTDGTPTPEQLVQINQHTLKDLTADELYVRQFVVAHTAIDRDGEVIGDDLIANMSKTLAGKGLFEKHPQSYDGSSAPGTGKWFSTELKTVSLDEARAVLGDVKFAPNATTAKLLYASAYVARTQKNADLISDIDAGIASFVSASFTYSDETPLEVQGVKVATLLHGEGEALEASLVWLGAQPGAKAVKSANSNKSTNNSEHEDSVMTKELETKIKTLTGERDGLQTKYESEKSAKETAEAELKKYKDAANGEGFEGVKALYAERAKTKSALIDTIVAADRQSGECGDSEDDIANAKKSYDGYPMEALQKLAAKSKAAGTGSSGNGIEGGDPNHRNKGAGEGDNALEACPV